jgi:hypothetical protein
MGTYTELVCAFALRGNTPPQVIGILLYMTGQSKIEPAELPQHPIFSTAGWESMLRSSSAYFKGDAHSTVRLDKYSGEYSVTIRCNFTDHDDELLKFIDWISDYMQALGGDFLGYSRAETTQVPTLIYVPRVFITPDIPEDELAGAVIDTDAWVEAGQRARASEGEK